MNTKMQKYVYWGSTGLLSAMTLMAVGNYLFDTESVMKVLEGLQYPANLVYVLAVAKFFGVIALWLKKCDTLKEWAYAGLSFIFILGAWSHINVNDGQFAPALVALTLLIVSYVFGKKIAKK